VQAPFGSKAFRTSEQCVNLQAMPALDDGVNDHHVVDPFRPTLASRTDGKLRIGDVFG
jgi:hypothetical protein